MSRCLKKIKSHWQVDSFQQETITTCLNQLKGTTNKTSLHYIISNHAILDVNVVYATESEALVQNSVSQGPQFN